jgi:hypothetical protein
VQHARWHIGIKISHSGIVQLIFRELKFHGNY